MAHGERGGHGGLMGDFFVSYRICMISIEEDPKSEVIRILASRGKPGMWRTESAGITES